MGRDRLGTMVAGLALISLGIAFLLAQWLGWDKIWPIFPMLGGLAFLGAWLGTGFQEGGFIFVGTGAVLVGLFFFGFSFGVWEWEEMATLWPIFPIIGGVAFAVMFLADRARDWGVLGVGCAAMLVGLGGLAFTFGLVGTQILDLLPLLLVLIGLFSLVGALIQMVRRK
jgi:hypothetical protein